MDFNKITSDLTFLGSTLHEINMVNKTASISVDSFKSFGMDVGISNIEITGEIRFAKLLMKITVEILEKSDKTSSITLVLEGTFSAPTAVSDEDFKNMVLINGAAALYSIGRSKIEMISAMTFINGKIILPMINIIEFYKMKKEEKDNEKE